MVRQEEHNYKVGLLQEAIEPIPKIRRSRKLINLDGDAVNICSLRLFTFKSKGTVCRGCGIIGSKIYKEKTKKDKRFHLNLYAINSSGHEVLMTKDHIIPKSLGGKNHITNLQPMCTNCNNKKGNG